MKVISHRGNLTGPNSVHENSLEAIDHCIYKLNISVEVDLRWMNGRLYLGHDLPEILIDSDKKFLKVFMDLKLFFGFCIQN